MIAAACGRMVDHLATGIENSRKDVFLWGVWPKARREERFKPKPENDGDVSLACRPIATVRLYLIGLL
jgi:hypothetical protein